jgi:hypothetical protein
VVSYLAGDSSFDAAPVGPVVVFGFESGVPLAPPVVVIAEPPPELMPDDDAPVVVDFCMASEFELVMFEFRHAKRTPRCGVVLG